MLQLVPSINPYTITFSTIFWEYNRYHHESKCYAENINSYVDWKPRQFYLLNMNLKPDPFCGVRTESTVYTGWF
jgi:hypothetical protein